MKYKLKVITGYRKDQEHSIDADEAHKAYYLFNHPDERGTFSNGLALSGVRDVIPDYQGTMGWNPTHVLDSDDWNEIHSSGAGKKLQAFMSAGKEIARLGDPQDLAVPLRELLAAKYPQLKNLNSERTSGMNRIAPPTSS
jgi:hypothetical protein